MTVARNAYCVSAKLLIGKETTSLKNYIIPGLEKWELFPATLAFIRRYFGGLAIIPVLP